MDEGARMPAILAMSEASLAEVFSTRALARLERAVELIGPRPIVEFDSPASRAALAKARILEDAGEVVRRAPDIILGSWCGKKFRPGKVAARPGWDAIPAVRDGQLFEIKSPIILQPGPAALTDGVAEIARHIRAWALEKGSE